MAFPPIEPRWPSLRSCLEYARYGSITITSEADARFAASIESTNLIIASELVKVVIKNTDLSLIDSKNCGLNSPSEN